MRLRLLLLALLLLTGCDDVGMFSVNRAAHPPPEGWEKLPLKPGANLVTFDDLTALDRFCESFLGPANKYNPRARYGGECYVPQTQTLALLSDAATPDKKAQAERKTHGYAHSWGLVHPGGDEKWIYPDGRPAQPITQAQAEMMVAMAQAEHRQRALAQTDKPKGLYGRLSQGN